MPFNFQCGMDSIEDLKSVLGNTSAEDRKNNDTDDDGAEEEVKAKQRPSSSKSDQINSVEVRICGISEGKRLRRLN